MKILKKIKGKHIAILFILIGDVSSFWILRDIDSSELSLLPILCSLSLCFTIIMIVLFLIINWDDSIF
jgi:hypothetical protein